MTADKYNIHTCIGKIRKELDKPITGHPSNEYDQRVKRLEKLMLLLAQEIETTRSMIP